MANPVPALCRSCGLFFGATKLFGGTGYEVTFKNVATNCPRCDSDADIFDGTYQMMGDAVRILSGAHLPADKLRSLADALTKARDANAGPEEIKGTIQEVAPELKKLSDLIPQKRSEVYSLLAMLLAAINIILSQCGRVTTEKAEQTIKHETSRPIAESVQAPAEQSKNPRSMNRAQRRTQRSKARHK